MFVCPECGSAQPVAGHCGHDGALLAPIGEDVLLGTTIGVYRIARLLGIGGMGRVYKGVHPTIGSRVAIKVLSRECSDRKDLVDRFFAEARAVNLIRHESIVNVLDLASLPDGRPYIVMEYLDGAPLAGVIEQAVVHQAPLPLGGLARLAAEVLDALGAAHAKGVIHRDLKPDNIYVTPNGRAKVLDFGIAKLDDLSTATRTGSLLGTPHYMSPEQATGRPVDHRADLYAMGVILFECATGTKPFQAPALFELLRKHLETPPPSPRARRPDMPPELEQVILVALAKAPDDRFASAAAMSQALHHATARLAPEQWASVTGGGARANANTWDPTPPVSWARSGRISAPPPLDQPIASVSAGHVTPMALGSAGQVTSSGGTRPSRKGLWLGLAALGLAGGGLAAAVLVSRAGTAPPLGGVAALEATKDREPMEAAPAALDSRQRPAHSPSVPGSSATASALPATPPATPSPATASARPSSPLASPPASALPATPPATASALPSSPLASPPAAPAPATSPPATSAPAMSPLVAPAPATSPPATSAPAAPRAPATSPLAAPPAPATPPAAPRSSWPVTTRLKPVFAFDQQRVDTAKYIAWAIAEARRAVPDAALTRIDMDGVRATGFADLTLSTPMGAEHGSLDLRFVSPSRARRDPNAVLGTKLDWKCEIRVEASPEGIELRPLDGFECKAAPIAIPRCTAAAIWRRAITEKPALAGANAVANLSYYGFKGGKAFWYFTIKDVISQRFTDDC